MRRLALAALVVAAFAQRADAAGLARPNVVGARAIGIGGGYAAIADDPTAVWHNPAGTAMYGDNVAYIGGELVLLNRTYTPDAQSPLGQAGITHTISENTAPTFIPVVGATTRFGFGKSAPSRFAFSLALYDAYGGSISFAPSALTAGGRVQGISSTTLSNLELAPALAYQVSDVLSVGAALRIGINNFSVSDTESSFVANLSGSGVGIGATLGVMVRPHRLVQIGAVYRTPLSASISGTSPVSFAGGDPKPTDFSLHVTWPQSAALGVTVFPLKRLLATVQADWTGWSSVQVLNPAIPGIPDSISTKQMRYQDTYTIHVGLQGVITRYLVARVGYSHDSNAIPDRTMRRENQDAEKDLVAAGLGVHFWKIFVDLAYELILPIGDRVIAQPLPSDMAPENESGRYKSLIMSAELSAQIRF